MAGRLDFTQYLAATTPQIERYQTWCLYCACGVAVTVSSAFFLRELLPPKVRSHLLILGTVSSMGAIASNEGLQRARQQQQPYLDAQQRQIELLNGSVEYIEEKRQRAIAAREAITAILEESPNEYFTIGFLNQQGLLDLMTGGEEVAQARAQPATHGQVVNTVATPATVSLQPQYPGNVQPVGDRVERSPLEKIPEEDLALTLAQSTADPSCATSVLIAAPRRCGKSNIVRQAIAYANNLHNANIDFNVWNGGKDDEDYCGLQNHDPDYLFTAHPENIEWATRLLLGDQGDEDSLALLRRCDRWVGYPTLLICDEWNNTLLAAQNADMLDKGNNYRDKLIVGSTQIVTRGPGKLVLGWFTSHSAFVKNVGWDEDIKKNISCVAIAPTHLRVFRSLTLEAVPLL
jgi:hypothetical protein